MIKSWNSAPLLVAYSSKPFEGLMLEALHAAGARF
jgi:hypothetical protein